MIQVDIYKDPFLRVLFFGLPGSTKTRTCGTAVLDRRTAPCLWLDAGGNPLSLRSFSEAPFVIRIEELRDVNDPYDFLVRGQPKDHILVQQFPGMKESIPFKSLVIDSVTQVHRYSFEAVMGTNALGPGDLPPKAQRQHFGSVLSQMIKFASLYYDLPLHVLMTCLEASYQDDETGAEKSAPLLWGQTGNELPGHAYVVCQLRHAASLPARLRNQIQVDPEVSTSVGFFTPTMISPYPKDQYGSLPPYMVDPSITKMLDAIYGEGT